MPPQIYEKYWSCTLAFTDIYGHKFSLYLNTIINFIQRNSKVPYSKKKYQGLQEDLKNIFNIDYISIRKAINQFVKLGFIDHELSSYHNDAVAFLSANNKEKKIIFSKIVYSNARLNNSVTQLSERKEINFLLKTLHKTKKLDKSDILALMSTNITEVKKGFLTRPELEKIKKHLKNINFLKRKYNQLGHFWSILKNLDGLISSRDNLCLEKDAPDLGLVTKTPSLHRDPYLHRIFKNQLKEESQGRFGDISCMLEGRPHKGLVASHIKPFISCSEEEAYDKDNGLLLNLNTDQLFDKGYITFENTGKVRISTHLPGSMIGDIPQHSLDPVFLTPKRIEYLQYHREHIFK